LPEIDDFLKKMIDKGASDILLCANSYPHIEVNGQLKIFTSAKFTPRNTAFMINEILSEDQKQYLDEHKNIDITYSVDHRNQRHRFKGHILFQRDGLDGYFKYIPNKIRSLAELNIPATVKNIFNQRQGLILLSGPTGCGKTATGAAIIDEINSNYSKHILTIEQPVEYLHKNKKSLITQRNVGIDSESYNRALKAALREDPDVIYIGQLIDSDTTKMALHASETGHLVIATINSAGSSQTIERILSAFPTQQQNQMRAMFSETLKGIITQYLIPTKDGKDRIPAVEILIGCLPISNAIREGKTFQIRSALQTGQSIGMKILDDSLLELYKAGKITPEAAKEFAYDKNIFN
jgi:twitching motility protein PilT